MTTMTKTPCRRDGRPPLDICVLSLRSFPFSYLTAACHNHRCITMSYRAFCTAAFTEWICSLCGHIATLLFLGLPSCTVKPACPCNTFAVPLGLELKLLTSPVPLLSHSDWLCVRDGRAGADTKAVPVMRDTVRLRFVPRLGAFECPRILRVSENHQSPPSSCQLACT